MFFSEYFFSLPFEKPTFIIKCTIIFSICWFWFLFDMKFTLSCCILPSYCKKGIFIWIKFISVWRFQWSLLQMWTYWQKCVAVPLRLFVLQLKSPLPLCTPTPHNHPIHAQLAALDVISKILVDSPLSHVPSQIRWKISNKIKSVKFNIFLWKSSSVTRSERRELNLAWKMNRSQLMEWNIANYKWHPAHRLSRMEANALN